MKHQKSRRSLSRKGSAPARQEPDLLWSGSQYLHGSTCGCSEVECLFAQIVYNDSLTQEEK